jgi:hypothetical protein
MPNGLGARRQEDQSPSAASTSTAAARREKWVVPISWLSGLLAVGSLMIAGLQRASPRFADWFCLSVVGFWVLVPPVWFWFEWYYLCRQLPLGERDRIKHLHDLARNIWLALVAVLVVLFGLDWKP